MKDRSNYITYEQKKALERDGLKGIGLYYVRTRCANCKRRGITLFELGAPVNTSGWFCIHCDASEENIEIEERIL